MSTQDTTAWAVAVSSTGTASLTVSTNGGTPQPFTIQGVCYSPCPIGGSNSVDQNLGDWFWDTFTVAGTSTTITNWSGTWQSDLQNIASLGGVNTIRVYCMIDQQMPANPNAPPATPQLFTHQSFLDACYANGLSVLVGFPTPPQYFDDEALTPAQDWWIVNLVQTVLEIGAHPAVLGIVIANEVDNGAVNTYGPPALATYWWRHVNRIACVAKLLAPKKLVGIAFHDDPGICENCASHMAECPYIDFWGVNTYQPESFQSVFGGGSFPTGYALLTGAALKPVILTEYGFPATSRPNALEPAGIYYDDATQQQTATTLNLMLPQVYQQPICLGMCYFEYCDEWWNQGGFQVPALTPGQATLCNCSGEPNCPVGDSKPKNIPAPNVYTWYGGQVACGFPNYYWDQDGFGLYAVGVGQGRSPAQPWDSTTNAPALPLDTRTARQIVIDALTAQYDPG